MAERLRSQAVEARSEALLRDAGQAAEAQLALLQRQLSGLAARQAAELQAERARLEAESELRLSEVGRRAIRSPIGILSVHR